MDTVFTTQEIDLTQATQPQRLSEGRFALHVPDGWQQGRGAFGGLVLGALTRALQSCEPEAARALRSLSGEIAGPVLPGEALIDVVVLRRGSTVTTLSTALHQGDEVRAHATAVLGRTRVRDRDQQPLPPPEIAAGWQAAPPLPAGMSLESLGPTFLRHFEVRPTGPLPYLGGQEQHTAGWLRVRRAPPVLAAPEIIALTDCFWPALLTTESVQRPVSTVAFTAQLFPPEAPLDPALPVFHRAFTAAAQDGYAVELRELWSAAGRLLSMNQQTFVIIK